MSLIALAAPPPPVAPQDEAALRQALYAGVIYLTSPLAPALALADHVEALLQAAFPEAPPRRAHAALPIREILARLTQVRAQLSDAAAEGLMDGVLRAVGLAPERYHRHGLRLRAVLPGCHHDPAAAAAYSLHRDTWFANPQAQINLWVALHDASARETVCFYPSLFQTAVVNDSAAFDYESFARRVGWQRLGPPPDAVYPTVREPPQAPRLTFACRRGQVLLFSAAQLHGPQGIEATGDGPPAPGSHGFARFSVDFRVVHGDDHAQGRGPRNVDNASRGSALRDYAPPR